MEDHQDPIPTATKRTPWNKGKLIGAKPPLWPKHVWSIRTKLQIEGRIRELALFNLAIDSKLRGCDLVGLRVEDIAPNGHAVTRAMVRQKRSMMHSPSLNKLKFKLLGQSGTALPESFPLMLRRVCGGVRPNTDTGH